jgi:hypothetical protein
VNDVHRMHGPSGHGSRAFHGFEHDHGSEILPVQSWSRL